MDLREKLRRDCEGGNAKPDCVEATDRKYRPHVEMGKYVTEEEGETGKRKVDAHAEKRTFICGRRRRQRVLTTTGGAQRTIQIQHALAYITTTATCQPTDLWPRCWFARRPAVVVRTLLSRQPVSRVSESALDVHEDGVESHQVRLEGEVAGVVLRRTVAVLVLRVAPLVALLVRELTETCTIVGLANINVNELIHIKTSMRTSTISIRDHLFKLQTTQFKLDVAKNSIYLVATGTNTLILLLPLTPLFTSRMHFALYISKRYWLSTYT